MDERKLRAYFTVPTWRAELALAVGAAGLVLFMLAAPGTAGYAELHRRATAVFVVELQAKAAPFEVIFLMGYILFFFLVPVALVGLGVAGLRLRFAIRNFNDAQADAMLFLRMSLLPGLLEERLGLAPMAEGDALLVLWGPTQKDRSLMHPLDRQKRREMKTTPGRFAVGKDGQVRFVKLHVLVLEKRGTTLFVLNGFYNLVHQQLAGETWGEYRLAQALKVKENPDDCRVALLMDDGTQFVVNLLTRQEGARLSQAAAYPLVVFSEAGEKLRQFCEIQSPAAII